jgi:hypothetical protein
VSAADITKVLDSLRAADARRQAVDLFIAAQQAAGIPSEAAKALGLLAQATGTKPDAALIQAAQAEQAAAVVQQGAEATFSVARKHMASLGVALYTSSPQATLKIQGDQAGVGKAYMSILTSRDLKSFAVEKGKLDAANQALEKTRNHSIQLVSLKAAAFASQAASTDPSIANAAAGSTPSPVSAKANGKNPPTPASDGSPTILGPTTLTGPELAGWFGSTGKQANATVPMSTLANDYVSAGRTEGVRADLAFAQSIIETGYFSFPSFGQVTPTDNNFAGIGACDSCSHGMAWPDAQTGVAAQLQLLHAYAAKGVTTPLIGSTPVPGCCPTWMALSGVWATNTGYGYSILKTYVRMLEWVVAERSRGAGL